MPTQPTVSFTFTKPERLCSRKLLDELFEKGKGTNQSPLRFVVLQSQVPQAFPVQVVITVSKKNFKSAVDRNRIKRLIRECYRLQKHVLYDFLNQQNKKILLAIIFTNRQLPDIAAIDAAMKKWMRKMVEETK